MEQNEKKLINVSRKRKCILNKNDYKDGNMKSKQQNIITNKRKKVKYVMRKQCS